MEAAMKAVQIQEYGDADVLRYVDVDDPVLNDDDVLIRVIGSSVNPVDWKIRAGHMKRWSHSPCRRFSGGMFRASCKRLGSQ
jgi:NADPH:quinone reductase-like Zn-dependent oxidoreductase